MLQIKYDIFTFQMSYYAQTNQLSLFGKNMSKEEVLYRKNKLFNSIFFEDLSFYHRRHKLNYKIDYYSDELILLRLANKKIVNIEKQFHRETFESEPSCLVAIYNHPDFQYIVIESDRSSFGNSFTVVKIIEDAFDKKLYKLNLKIKIHPNYEEKEFWKIVKRYEAEIEAIRFEFEYPNLSRVNKYLTDELKEASKLINSGKTKVEFSAEKDNILQNLNEDNKQLSSLVKTSAEGAGPVKIKVKNLRRWESTDNKVKSFEFDELEVDAPKELILNYVEALKNLLNYE